jgi:hypothetical protein
MWFQAVQERTSLSEAVHNFIYVLAQNTVKYDKNRDNAIVAPYDDVMREVLQDERMISLIHNLDTIDQEVEHDEIDGSLSSHTTLVLNLISRKCKEKEWHIPSAYCQFFGILMECLLNVQMQYTTSAVLKPVHLVLPPDFCTRVNLELGEFRMTAEVGKGHRVLDEYYAKLVHGASVSLKMNTIWVPSDDIDHSEFDSNQFAELNTQLLSRLVDAGVRNYRISVDPTVIAKNTAPTPAPVPGVVPQDPYKPKLAGDRVKKAIENSTINDPDFMHLLLQIQNQIKNVWQSAHVYQVSMFAHSAEVGIINRLISDGVVYLPNGWQHLSMCNLLRRTDIYRNEFAQAVGKKLLTERCVISSRGSMIEHRRTANWAERQYLSLLQFMKKNPIRDITSEQNKKLVVDYTGTSSLNPQEHLCTFNGIERWRLTQIMQYLSDDNKNKNNGKLRRTS